MCAHKVAEPLSAGSPIEAWLTWAGGGERRELNERHERSAHAVAGVIVLLNAALAWLVTSLAVTEATRLPVLAVAAPPEGRDAAADRPGGPIPFTPGARKCLENTLREAVAQHQTGIGVEHIALGLLVTNRGLVPPILDEAGLSAPALRAAILDRYRPAS